MSVKEINLKKKLKKQIIIACEKAYRRGYQHGNLYASDGVTQEHCSVYRYFKPIEKQIGCPEKHSDGEIRMVDQTKLFGNLEWVHLNTDIDEAIKDIFDFYKDRKR
jgi:hypothetical protein